MNKYKLFPNLDLRTESEKIHCWADDFCTNKSYMKRRTSKMFITPNWLTTPQQNIQFSQMRCYHVFVIKSLYRLHQIFLTLGNVISQMVTECWLRLPFQCSIIFDLQKNLLPTEMHGYFTTSSHTSSLTTY